MHTKLVTQAQHEQLLKNGEEPRRSRGRGEMIDFRPVVKLFTPDAQATWLLSELYPDDSDVAFGLCDLGIGFPELGDVPISELEALRGPLNLPVERDGLAAARRETDKERAELAHEISDLETKLEAAESRRASLAATLEAEQKRERDVPRRAFSCLVVSVASSSQLPAALSGATLSFLGSSSVGASGAGTLPFRMRSTSRALRAR